MAVTISVTAVDRFSFEHCFSETMSCFPRCPKTEKLKQIHGRLLKTGRILQQSKDTFLWNLMIRGFSSSDEPERSRLLYQHMLCWSAPLNAHTFPILLKACSNLSLYEETKQIHAQIIKFGYAADIYAIKSLINAYAIPGDIQSAHLLFDGVQEHDSVSWNSLIKGYIKVGKMSIAMELFTKMPEKNVISWTTMISGFVHAGMNGEALDLFQKMQNADVVPDNVSLAKALSACTQLGALEQGKWIHTYINKRRIRIDSVLGCVLIDMYAKCGDIEGALNVFGTMKERSVHAWTALISGLASHGHGRAALKKFMAMQKMGIKPNLVTFTAALTACSYTGLVDEGKLLFYSMERTYKLKPTIEHYGCMVDLLGRAGLLDEAKEFIEKMPLNPNGVIWGALLKACQVHKNIKLGQEIGEILIRLDPDHGGRYVHAANIHAMAGKWDRAGEARKLMKDRRVLKVPGCSTISVNECIHEFLAGDRSHPEIGAIHSKWKMIGAELGENGYIPEIEIPLDLADDEREAAVHQHSEKLAVTYGLMKTKPGSVIRVVKNLRVCKDCHKVTKLISKIYRRDIIMRDRARFHYFRDGECSCGDYW